MRIVEVATIVVTSLFLLSPGPTSAATLPQPEAAIAGTKPVAAPAAAPAATPAPVVDSQPSAPATQTPTSPASAATATPAEPPKPVLPSLVAKVNLTTQTMTVAVHGRVVQTWKVSSGAFGYETPVGNFKPDWMSKMWYSKQYDDAPMPHSVFFKNGAAVHGTTSTGRLGTAASHGCVRLSLANADTFYKLVGRHGLGMTRIIVSGRAPVRDVPREYRREDRIVQRDSRRDGNVRWQAAAPVAASVAQARPANRQLTQPFVYPGERYAYGYPSGSVQVNRTPYWAR